MLFEGDTEPTPSEGMVTIGRFANPMEAQMAKGMLESAGVECLLVGENVNNLLQAAFRVRLQVLVEDEAAARGLMAQTAVEQPSESIAEG